MQLKNKKINNKTKPVRVERSADEWQRVIQEAKKKEVNWKFIREDTGDDGEREEEA